MGAAAAGSAAIVVDRPRFQFIHFAGDGCVHCNASRIRSCLADPGHSAPCDTRRRGQPAAGRQPGHTVAASESGHAAASG